MCVLLSKCPFQLYSSIPPSSCNLFTMSLPYSEHPFMSSNHYFKYVLVLACPILNNLLPTSFFRWLSQSQSNISATGWSLSSWFRGREVASKSACQLQILTILNVQDVVWFHCGVEKQYIDFKNESWVNLDKNFGCLMTT
jgi:hypothetical protein